MTSMTWRQLLTKVCWAGVLAIGLAGCGLERHDLGSGGGRDYHSFYYSSKEESYLGYKDYYYYIFFWDDHRFSSWKTKEPPQVVSRRLADYLSDHHAADIPRGIHIYAEYRLDGDKLSGHREVPSSIGGATFEQKFEGDLVGDHLHIREVDWYRGTKGAQSKPLTVDRELVKYEF